MAALRCGTGPHEVHQATDCTKIAAAGHLGVCLARQIDFDDRVDCMELGKHGGHAQVVGVVRAAHGDQFCALGKVAQPVGSEQATSHGQSTVDTLECIRENA